MNVAIDLRVLELLCAHLCHELVSPVAAINNGVELLGEDDPEFVKEATALLGQSARKAGQRLQFYRFAYGSTGGGGAALDCRGLALGLLEGGKVRCDWAGEVAAMSADWQKLAGNLLVLAAEALPRGGGVSVAPQAGGLVVTAEGVSVNFPDETRAALAATTASETLTSRTVQAYFTARLAERLGASLAIETAAAKLVLTARPK